MHLIEEMSAFHGLSAGRGLQEVFSKIEYAMETGLLGLVRAVEMDVWREVCSKLHQKFASLWTTGHIKTKRCQVD